MGTDVETKPGLITVNAIVPPQAFFAIGALDAAPGEDITFTDMSIPGTSPITEWEWDFGDGEQTVTAIGTAMHAYAAPGVYTVSLTVRTAHGEDTAVQEDAITIASNAPPTAQFTATPTGGTVALHVVFTDTSLPGGLPIIAWEWDFGDGASSTEQHPEHTYTTAGVYSVTLTVITANASDSVIYADHITVTEGPEADFSSAGSPGDAPLAIQFTDLSRPGAAPIVSWLWDFGDGHTSTMQHPEHTYEYAGRYTVSLTVETAAGSDTETRSEYIVVLGRPKITLTADVSEGLSPLAVQFSYDSGGFGDSWTWDFGDGVTSTHVAPAHTFVEPGSYTVTLSLSEMADGTYTETLAITVTGTAMLPVDGGAFLMGDTDVPPFEPAGAPLYLMLQLNAQGWGGGDRNGPGGNAWTGGTVGNGIMDLVEATLLEAILLDPALPHHAEITAAWERNLQNLTTLTTNPAWAGAGLWGALNENGQRTSG